MYKYKNNEVEVEVASFNELLEIMNKFNNKTQIKNIIDKKHNFKQIDLPLDNDPFIKKNSDISKVRKVLLLNGGPLHINKILKLINKRGAKSKNSISATITKYIKRGIFVKTGIRTFDLVRNIPQAINEVKKVKKQYNQRKYPCVCVHCGIDFMGFSKKSKYCSKAHSNLYLAGRLAKWRELQKKNPDEVTVPMIDKPFSDGVIRRRSGEEIRVI